MESTVDMKTTVLLVEFLVAGALVSLVLGLCAYSFFPDDVERIFNNLFQCTSASIGILYATIFIAISYGAGILSEYIGLHIFEGRHDEIKKDRIRTYVKKLQNENIHLEKNPIFRNLAEVPPERITKKQARSCIGPMRFYVLKESPYLYQDIDSQLHRLRLIRIMVLVEVCLIVAIGWRLCYNLVVHHYFSAPLACALIFFGGVIVVNYKAILDRFNRYCRAVERSYKALVFDKKPTREGEP
jgi:hypothetical protein